MKELLTEVWVELRELKKNGEASVQSLKGQKEKAELPESSESLLT